MKYEYLGYKLLQIYFYILYNYVYYISLEYKLILWIKCGYRYLDILIDYIMELLYTFLGVIILLWLSSCDPILGTGS